MSERKNVLRSAGLVSGATVLSRILGLARDVITASVFGTGLVYDAFVIAFMVPNLLRGLLGEGALNSAFIPVVSEYMEKNDREQAFQVAHIVMSVLAVILVGFVFGVLGVSQLVLMWGHLSAKMTMVLKLVQTMSPYVIFVCLAALMMGVLNILKHFAVPAFSPVLLNVLWILSLFVLCPLFGETPEKRIFGLAAGVLLAGVIQWAIQLPVARKKGYVWRWCFNKESWQHPAVRKIYRLMIPVFLAYAVNQINVVVDIILAYHLGPGMQSSLWYAQRIIYFPLGVFGVAMSIALMPTLSRLAAQKQAKPLLDMVGFALRAELMIILPCAVAIMVLCEPMVRLFYARGSFDEMSVMQTAWPLFFYALGLVPFAGNKIVLPAYYAMQDTKTPVRLGLFCVVLNLLLNLILMGPLKQGGLALGTVISAFVNLMGLFYFLEKRVGSFDWRGLSLSLLKVSVASALYGWICFAVHKQVAHVMQPGLHRSLAEVFVPLAAAFAFLGVFYALTGRQELQVLWKRRK